MFVSGSLHVDSSGTAYCGPAQRGESCGAANRATNLAATVRNASALLAHALRRDLHKLKETAGAVSIWGCLSSMKRRPDDFAPLGPHRGACNICEIDGDLTPTISRQQACDE